jgi:hypothetical protein
VPSLFKKKKFQSQGHDIFHHGQKDGQTGFVATVQSKSSYMKNLHPDQDIFFSI